MKVFDFTDGKKGEQLGSIRYEGGNTAITGKDGNSYTVTVAGRFNLCGSLYRFGPQMNAVEVKAADYGVEAICFCEHYISGEREDVFEWNCLVDDLDTARTWIQSGKATCKARG